MNQQVITLKHPSKKIQGTVQLTGSKSESNRALIIQSLSKGQVAIANLSEAADTVTLNRVLQIARNPQPGYNTIDIGPAGTAMRFLTAYLNLVKGNFILTGTERMQQRPIGILVDAMKEIGAEIHYEKKVGYPPLKIEGGLFQGKDRVKIQGNISSQYISALLLIAPALKKGLTLEIEGELTSRPYVSMTLDMLKSVGIQHEWTENAIKIAPQAFEKQTIFVEPDWSAASYWYAIVALGDATASIVLPGLRQNSLQGDIAIASIMEHFGVQSSFESDGLHLTKKEIDSDKTLFDFKECPDLAQTVVVVAAALKRDISFIGLETLKIKETDRIAALQKEIAKFGAELIEDGYTYHLKTAQVYQPKQVTFDTYEDHRMAMAFAPLALVFDQINIAEPQVVEKSYPDFWNHLQAQAFVID
jgi:3-phosphoshikimate 1-carboxyvinyltransferase